LSLNQFAAKDHGLVVSEHAVPFEVMRSRTLDQHPVVGTSFQRIAIDEIGPDIPLYVLGEGFQGSWLRQGVSGVQEDEVFPGGCGEADVHGVV